MKSVRRAGLLLMGALLAAVPTRAQTIVVFDEPAETAATHWERSAGSYEPSDSLHLAPGAKLPLEVGRAFSGETSGLLEYRHAGGAWRMAVSPPEAGEYNVLGFDSVVVYLNGPAAIAGGELPRIRLQDDDGGTTRSLWISTPENVRVADEATGFTAESVTNAILLAEYIDALPADVRRPGYPEALTVTFADEPLDTSVAAIGLPAVPANFEITTVTGLRADFSFRDLDEDGTLSRTDEYIDIRLPDAEGSSRTVTAWRLALAPTQGPEPLDPPGAGDVYHLAVAFDELALDGDPDSWQRVSIPMDELTADGDFTFEHFDAVVFEHGARTAGMRTVWFDRLEIRKRDDTAFLDMVQERTFRYFWDEANPGNGLVRDRSREGSPASIAAVGFGLSAYTVGIDRGWITREQGRNRVAATLRFFWNAPQSTATDATGYKGFFYHFLDMQTGRRAWNSELSTIDTALLLGGVLHVGEYFDGADVAEVEIRALADSIYRRVDFAWMQNRGRTQSAALSHGWFPDPEGRGNADPVTGFIVNDWIGYNEAMILYILALGSPTHPATEDAWDAWVSGYDDQWRTEYGYTFLTFPPLFGHQYSHVWIDFRAIRDAYMRSKGIDYFENSRRATMAQRAYHIANPRGYPNYGPNEWGLTASDTPTGYRARGAPPPQNDDGTLVPTAPGGSIAFTPDESIAALRTMYDRHAARLWGPYGFRDAYNVQENWFDEDYIGIDQGPILLMIENHRTQTIWDVTMRNEYVRQGLERAGFRPANLSAGEHPERIVPEIGAFPNPATSRAHVTFVMPESGPFSLDIYDVLGRRIARIDAGHKPSGAHQAEADLSGLPAGTYFLVLESPRGSLAKPLVVF